MKLTKDQWKWKGTKEMQIIKRKREEREQKLNA